MDGRSRAVAVPASIGAGGLIEAIVVWQTESPLWAWLTLMVIVAGTFVLAIMFFGFAKRLVTDALSRGTSLDISYHAFKIRVGRNTLSPRAEPPPEPKDRP